MNKQKCIQLFKDKFKQLSDKDFKLILYRNPFEFVWFQLEYVNPNHKINIYGIPKRKLRKENYLKYYKVGRIILSAYLPIYLVFNLNLLDVLLPGILMTWLTIKLMFFVIEQEFIYNANRNRRRTWRWKNNIISQIS